MSAPYLCRCGCEFNWSAQKISDGLDRRCVFYGLELANCPHCGTTAAKHVNVKRAEPVNEVSL